jgi:hypothetical protein
MKAGPSSKARLAVGCALALILLLVVQARGRQASLSSRAARAATVAPTVKPPLHRATQREGLANGANVALDERTDNGSSAPQADAATIDYERSSVYPPSSRPLRETDRSLIDWNARYEMPRPVLGDPQLRVLFTADRALVIGEEPLNLRFVAYGAELSGLEVSAAPINNSVAPISVAMQPKHGEFVGQFAPAALALTSPNHVRFTARYKTSTGVTDDVLIHAEVHPSATLPAAFTGRFREQVEAGSLAIYAEVNVAREGYYLVDANLYSNASPVAWTRFKGTLPSGLTEVRLAFFGKVLRDHAAADPSSRTLGPYELGQLRGALLAPESDPELLRLAPAEAPFTTKSYELDELSDAAFDSSFKQAKLAKLRELALNGTGPTISRQP